jgi:hypothetical protein
MDWLVGIWKWVEETLHTVFVSDETEMDETVEPKFWQDGKEIFPECPGCLEEGRHVVGQYLKKRVIPSPTNQISDSYSLI